MMTFSLESVAAECEVGQMIFSTSKSETMVLRCGLGMSSCPSSGV